MTSTAPAAHTLFVVPCAAAKLDTPAPAAQLYASANFAHILNAAITEAADTARVLGTTTKVMILSAEHGLLELDEMVAPYDTKMGQAGSISSQDVRFQLAHLNPAEIVAMLPAAYLRTLREAVDAGNDRGTFDIDLMDAYEAAPGIGFQRGVAASLVRTTGALAGV